MEGCGAVVESAQGNRGAPGRMRHFSTRFQPQPYASLASDPSQHDMGKVTNATYKSALALVPPSTIAAPIQAVRRRHDRHFARWPPHVNLLYPFIATPSHVIEHEGGKSSSLLNEDIRRRIRNAVQPVQPFTMSLRAGPPGIYTPPQRRKGQRTRVVLLEPMGSSVYKLQAALQAEFPECNAHERAYTPFLSVGQVTSYHGALDIVKETKRTVSQFITSLDPTPRAVLDWYVDKVFVLERHDFREPFKVVASIELGREES